MYISLVNAGNSHYQHLLEAAIGNTQPVRPFHERPYRPCVGIMLINKDNLVLVAQRIDQVAEAWQMPQGGVDEGETPQQAALRELDEEIGTNKVKIIGETKEWIPYDLPQNLADEVWNGRFRGQTQKWFAMQFLGNDDDIDLATENPEFIEWKWTIIDNLLNVAASFKRDNYAQVIAAFRHLL